MTEQPEGRAIRNVAAAGDKSLCISLLPFVLSVTAGTADVISFVGLGGLFNAHVTGNLVILAAHLVNRQSAPVAPMLSVPVFVAVLAVTKVLAAGLERMAMRSLQPLLALQFILLTIFLVLCVAAGPQVDPDAPGPIVAGMFGVAAMAVQNALVQLSLVGAPTTAVMTSNITHLVLDAVAVVVGRDPGEVASARNRAGRTWPPVFGFALGCALGAAGQAAVGLSSLALSVALALVALGMGISGRFDPRAK